MYYERLVLCSFVNFYIDEKTRVYFVFVCSYISILQYVSCVYAIVYYCTSHQYVHVVLCQGNQYNASIPPYTAYSSSFVVFEAYIVNLEARTLTIDFVGRDANVQYYIQGVITIVTLYKRLTLSSPWHLCFILLGYLNFCW